MKGWVGLVGWPVADGLPTQWSPVGCRPSAGRGQFAGQRPAFHQLCYATNVRGPSGNQIYSSPILNYHDIHYCLYYTVRLPLSSLCDMSDRWVTFGDYIGPDLHDVIRTCSESEHAELIKHLPVLVRVDWWSKCSTITVLWNCIWTTDRWTTGSH